MKARRESGRSKRWSAKTGTRKGESWFIAGRNGVRECLFSPHVSVRQLWIKPSEIGWLETLDLPSECRRNLEVVESTRIETPHGNLVQGIAVCVQPPLWGDLDDVLSHVLESGRDALALVLDQVEDPMNVGQILRTAEGAGVDFVVLPKKRSAQLNQTVAQVSQGAFAWVPVLSVTNLRQALDHMKSMGLWVYGCHGGEGSMPWHRSDLSRPLALVLGSEGRGLRRLTLETCDAVLGLPMAGSLESLNVSASAAAFLFETVRQRCSKQDGEKR